MNSKSKKNTKTESAKISILDNFINNIVLKEKQKKLIEVLKESTITFVTGPAGTAKTFTACYHAIYSLYNGGSIKKIILTKPIVESGENLGFLPGDVDSKVAPFMESFALTFEKILGKEQYNSLLKSEKIEFRPLAYMRGATFDNAYLICDEAQNASFKQLMTYITRLGLNSKMVIAGDMSQIDIKYNLVGLNTFIEIIGGVNGVSEFTFEKNDIIRNKILIDIIDKYENYKEDKLKELSMNNKNSKILSKNDNTIISIGV